MRTLLFSLALLLPLLGACASAPLAPPDRPRLWRSPPPAADGSEAGGVSVGVAAIVNESDGTTESFGLYQYLLEHPIETAEGRARPVLVDHPTEATYAVSGRVRGTMKYGFDPPGGAMAGGLLLTLMGAAAAGVGGVLAAADAIEPDVGGKILIGGAVVGGTGLGLQIGAVALEPHHRYEWDQSAELTLRRRGAKIDTFELHARGSDARRTELAGFHDRSLAPIWQALALRVERRIEADGGTGAP